MLNPQFQKSLEALTVIMVRVTVRRHTRAEGRRIAQSDGRTQIAV
ncbi:MAG: hypothetical protein ABSD74_01560 [Rhizomicrobium sp.]|jgi:hypothetical protein